LQRSFADLWYNRCKYGVGIANEVEPDGASMRHIRPLLCTGADPIDDERRRRILLDALISISAVVALGYLGVFLYGVRQPAISGVVVSPLAGPVGLLACLAGYILNRRCRLELAAAVFMLFLTGAIAVAGGHHAYGSAVPLMLALPIFASSMLVRPWAGLAFGALATIVVAAVRSTSAVVGLAWEVAFFSVLGLIAWLSSDAVERGLAASRAMARSLSEEEARYRILFEKARDAVLILDKGCVSDCNARASEVFGLSKEELLGRSPADLSPELQPDGRRSDALAATLLARAWAGETQNFEWEHLRGDGSPFPADVTLDRIEIGSQALVQAVVHDESERRRAEMALRESETKYRQLFDLESDALLLVDSDTGRILEANEAAVRLYGYSRTELLEMHNYELSAQPEETRAPVSERRRRVWLRYSRRKDGTVFPVEVTASYFDWQGRSVQIAANRDITERLAAQEELEHRRELLMRIIEQVPYPIFVLNRAMRFTVANKALASLFGLSVDEVIGSSPYQVLPSKAEARRFVDEARRVLRNGQTRRSPEELLTDGDGVVRFFQVIREPLHLTFSEELHVLGVAVDITERKRFEARLVEVQKMEAIGRLAGGVAHDFNNLLTVINGYCEFALQSLGPDAHVYSDLEEIYHAGERAAELTRQLLALSRRQMLEPRVLNLNDVLRDMSRMLERLMGEHITVRLELAKHLPSIKADPGQLEQALLNLATNAHDAMPEGGTLTLTTSTVRVDRAMASEHMGTGPGHYVLLTVTDTGPGLPCEVMEHLFEPFVTTKERGKGTGLGLASVYGIVTQSGGNIIAENLPEGGASFSIYLPVHGSERDSETKVGAEDPLPTGSETILVVEDEESLRLLTVRNLRRLGYHVLAAESGAAALRILEERGRPVDLILTDVVMPEMSGHALVKELRSRWPQSRVLYMSGYSSELMENHVLEQHEAGLIQKPFTAKQLAETVREALDT